MLLFQSCENWLPLGLLGLNDTPACPGSQTAPAVTEPRAILSLPGRDRRRGRPPHPADGLGIWLSRDASPTGVQPGDMPPCSGGGR